MGATTAYVPLGLATSGGRLGVASGLTAVALGISFHLFAFPLNDAIDLAIDKTNPRRADGPLVRGLVSRRFVVGLALVQIPIMAALLATIPSGSGDGRWLSWFAAVGLLGAYDLWGKRIAVPYAVDVTQGVGFAALVLLGATLGPGPAPLTWLIAAYVVAYITQINAVHGGLRDLANDLGHGAKTTAILLGCTIDESGVPVLSPPMAALAVTTEVAMLALIGASFWLIPWQFAAVALLLRANGTRLGVGAFKRRHDNAQLMAHGVWHLFYALLAAVVVGVGVAAVAVAALIIGVFILPPTWFAWLTRAADSQDPTTRRVGAAE